MARPIKELVTRIECPHARADIDLPFKTKV
jgi:hypothetical protein